MSIIEFPQLEDKTLNKLKTKAGSITGFFMTTDLSDFDSSWAHRGFYLYICVRELSDSKVDKDLKKSGVPLLIQVSNNSARPSAESVVFLHGTGQQVFHHRDRRFFEWKSAAIPVAGSEYIIHNVFFNKKITKISFVKKSISEEELLEWEEYEIAYGDSAVDRYNEYYAEKKSSSSPAVLEIQSVAKVTTSSCDSWPFINYGLPPQEPPESKTEEPAVQSQSLSLSAGIDFIPENAPYTPIEKIDRQ